MASDYRNQKKTMTNIINDLILLIPPVNTDPRNNFSLVSISFLQELKSTEQTTRATMAILDCHLRVRSVNFIF